MTELTPKQIEQLTCLMEEAAEVIQVCGKIKRFGFESAHPGGGPTNRQLLEIELGDVEAWKRQLIAGGDLDPVMIEESAATKMKRSARFLKHQSIVTDLPNNEPTPRIHKVI